MNVRLRDVADRAGVSVKTVSNVVNGFRHVRPETRARVQAAVDELGYRPNLSARSLRRGRSGLIALAVPALDVPYFAELACAVVAAAEARGWTVLVDQTDGDGGREREVAAGLRGHLIDGLILSPVALRTQDLRRTDADIPLVLLGERITQGAVDHVAVDNVSAARTATEHLLELGRRRIAAIGVQEHPHAASGVAALRRTGFEQAVRDAHRAVPDAWMPPVAEYSRTRGAAAMSAILDAGPPVPDAVFCFSDLLALGALRALADRGLRVPDDVAVIGFDDIEDGRFSNPTLSTIAPDKATIARVAVDLLHDRISRAGDPEPHDVRVSYELRARASTLGEASSRT
jgi:DNA-binding LacI/PurR family transcriptional regulator